jgi:hypothetical protein
VAQQGHVAIYGDISFSSCEFAIQPPFQVREAYLVVDYAIPFEGLRFTTEPPQCSNFTFLSLTPQGLYIAPPGNPLIGWEIGAPCTSTPGPHLLATILYLTGTTPSPCCTWNIDPWPASPRNEIEIVACDGFVGFAESHPASLNGYCLCDIHDYALGPYKPAPADGAVDVPHTTQLASEDDCCNDMTLFLSTEPFTNFPYDAVVYEGPKQNPFTPQLAPNMTYYWAVVEWATISPHGYEGYSRVWSFTTSDAVVPVGPSTWGRIKALFN